VALECPENLERTKNREKANRKTLENHIKT
jgi:hypothetical protein